MSDEQTLRDDEAFVFGDETGQKRKVQRKPKNPKPAKVSKPEGAAPKKQRSKKSDLKAVEREIRKSKKAKKSDTAEVPAASADASSAVDGKKQRASVKKAAAKPVARSLLGRGKPAPAAGGSVISQQIIEMLVEEANKRIEEKKAVAATALASIANGSPCDMTAPPVAVCGDAPTVREP